ncbi:MAG: 30S ribosomal protein S16 [Patescibacteria group bacterium]
MITIRLSRVGKTKQPIYRLIVSDKRKDPWGKYLENLGTFNPRTEPATVDFKVDRIKYWISIGAQTSATVWNLLVDKKILEGAKRKTVSISQSRKAKLEKKKSA